MHRMCRCDMALEECHRNSLFTVGKTFSAESAAVSENGGGVGGIGQGPAQTEF